MLRLSLRRRRLLVLLRLGRLGLGLVVAGGLVLVVVVGWSSGLK